jgi:hypothetical protein
VIGGLDQLQRVFGEVCKPCENCSRRRRKRKVRPGDDVAVERPTAAVDSAGGRWDCHCPRVVVAAAPVRCGAVRVGVGGAYVTALAAGRPSVPAQKPSNKGSS